MKVNIEVKLKSFLVPNYVIAEQAPLPRQEGFKELPKYALSELDAKTLDKLCEEFTQAVFDKAGKERLPTQQ